MEKIVRRRRLIASDPYAGYLLFDSVTRADNAASAGAPSEKGSAYVAQVGTWGVSSNKIECSSASGSNVLSAEVGASEHDHNATWFSDSYVNHEPGNMVRLIDGNNFILFVNNAGTACRIYKRDNGSFTLLASATGTFVDGVAALVRTTARSNVIVGYINGTQIATYTLAGTDATKFGTGTGTKVGFYQAGGTAPRYSAVFVKP